MKKMTGVGAVLLLSCMAIVFSLASCNTPMDKQEIRYTVWRDQSTPDVYQEKFQHTLADGYFSWIEFDIATWNKLSQKLTDTGKFMWTKAQITEWLRDQGLDEEQAAERLTWLTTIEHGCIASRHKDTVYYLFK